MKTLVAAVALAGLLVAASPAQANSIIQGQVGGFVQIQSFLPGQSFHAEDAHILSIGFWIRDMNPVVDDHDVDILLYQGLGSGGALLGSGTYSSIPTGFEGWVDVPFSSVTLVPGAVYSAFIADASPRWGVSLVSIFTAGDPYAGGTAILNGKANDFTDLTFRVLAPEAAVPEPGSLGLVLLGTLALVGHTRRRLGQA